MKLSSASAYAVRALVFLARHPGNRPVSADTVAPAEGLPGLFAGKVLKPLVSAGVLLSLRGPNGGYRLGRPVKAASLLDVVEAVQGPVRGDVPRWTTAAAGARLDARIQEACDAAAEVVRRQLRRVTVANLTTEEAG
jgi:Rrf2 family protein